MRRLFPALAPLLAIVLLAGCGGGSDDSSAPTTASDRSGSDWCEQLDDEPTDELVDAVPAQHRKAAEIVVAFSTAVGGQLEADESGAPASDTAVTALAEQVVGESDRLDAFAAEVQETCSDLGDDAVTALTALTTTAALASEERDDAYCDALAASFEEDGGGIDQISALAAQAPGSHRVALESIAAAGQTAANGTLPDDRATNDAIASFMGLGLYAETVCGIDDAFAQMLLAGALFGMSEGGPGETNAGTTGAEPPTADVSAAQAAVPAGSDVTFTASTVPLDENGERSVSVPVPIGWDVDDQFGVTVEPPDGSDHGFFTSITLDAGCDGMCEVTDWEDRLRSPEGYITNWASDLDAAQDRPTQGGTGAVIIATTASGDAHALVVRWDDAVDHYFRCEVSLDADDAPLLDSFVAACEAARPNWFAVG